MVNYLNRNIHLQIMSIGLSDLIWKVFATIRNLTDEKNKTLNFFSDRTFVNINCDLGLPLDKVTYFDDIVTWFNFVDKIVYREKTHYFVAAYVCKAKLCCLHK